MERLSIFDIYKIGVGPSSSHTLGPWKAAMRFADYLKNENAGSVDTDQKTFLHIKCGDAWLEILEFQPEGKKRMKVEDFFRGNKL